MKVWSIVLIFTVAAVNAKLQQVKQNDADCNGSYKETVQYFVLLNAENCNKNADLNDESVKLIIATTEVIHKCIGEIIRALRSDREFVLVGENKTAVDLAILSLHNQTGLYFNNTVAEPKNLTIAILRNSKLEIRAFVAEAIHEQLYVLISDQKYKEAVDMSKYLYTKHFNYFKETISHKVYDKLMQKGNGYELMSFVYKLVQNNEKTIIKDWFPLEFQWIFNGNTVRLLNNERNSMMRLSTDTDIDNDRRAYIDCKGSAESDGFFMFNASWNTNLNSVVFEIQNRRYGMKIKLDANTLSDSTDRLAWGDKRTADSRFAWRLKPGLNKNGELAFCLTDVVYNSYLSHGSCSSKTVDVKGIKGTCTLDMGWVMDNSIP